MPCPLPLSAAKLAEADLQCTLAVSIHAGNQALRESLIPRCFFRVKVGNQSRREAAAALLGALSLTKMSGDILCYQAHFRPSVSPAAITFLESSWKLQRARIPPGGADARLPLAADSLHCHRFQAKIMTFPPLSCSARAYPLEALMHDCRAYFAATGRRVTFEYTLMAGVNASQQDVRLTLLLNCRALCTIAGRLVRTISSALAACWRCSSKDIKTGVQKKLTACATPAAGGAAGGAAATLRPALARQRHPGECCTLLTPPSNILFGPGSRLQCLW